MPPMLAQALAEIPAIRAAVQVTAAAVCLYYVLLFAQSYCKLYLLQTSNFSPTSFSGVRYGSPAVAKVKYHNNRDALAILADRSVGNLHEQAWPFLISMWMHALLVDDGRGQITLWFGVIWVLSRAVYPIFFSVGHPWLQCSTVPGYVVVWYFLVSSLCQACLANPADPSAVGMLVAGLAVVGATGITTAGYGMRHLAT